jgi:hypothetical protein
MVDDVESKQATAIFVTPSALQEWSNGMEANSRLGPYADAMREVGPGRGVLVDDLNPRSVEYLNMIGQSAAQDIYIDGDKAHFTKAGATQMAGFVAEDGGYLLWWFKPSHARRPPVRDGSWRRRGSALHRHPLSL